MTEEAAQASVLYRFALLSNVHEHKKDDEHVPQCNEDAKVLKRAEKLANAIAGSARVWIDERLVCVRGGETKIEYSTSVDE